MDISNSNNNNNNKIEEESYRELVRKTLFSLYSQYVRHQQEDDNYHGSHSKEEIDLYVEKQVKRFRDSIEQRGFDEQRTLLKTILTILEFDPTEESLNSVEKILLFERKNRKLLDVHDIQPNWTSTSENSSKVKICVWRGDITTLKIGAIVNAANSVMLGCFKPNHPCIDNAIHTWAGPKLRKECREFMLKQNFEDEPTGQAKLTKGYCLPADFVLHTVGPIIEKPNDPLQPELLSSCYRSCLEMCRQNKIRSIAFCCISTGVFGYPQVPAAQVALKTVKQYLEQHSDHGFEAIVFNTFLKTDLEIYEEFLPKYFPSSNNNNK